MSKLDDFKIKPDEIKTVDKSAQSLARVDEVAVSKGYVSRDPRKTKPRSPRTAQIHAWVRPYVREWLIAESLKRGINQGLVLEAACKLYEKYGYNDEAITEAEILKP